MLLDWKMTLLPKATLRFNVIPFKLPMTFFTDLGQKILQFVWNQKKTLNSQSNPEKQNGAGAVRLPNFRLWYKVTVTRTERHLQSCSNHH